MTDIHGPDALMRAQERAEARLRLYKHVAAAAGLSLIFLVINLFVSRHSWWFLWPTGAVWLGVGVHALKRYGRGSAESLRGRLVERELSKEREREGKQG